MASETLREYYNTNYTRCQLRSSFLSSWEGLVYSSHCVQFLALPVQVLTAYLILRKTPESMKTMKTPLIVSHLCCSLLDMVICSLVTPFLYLPSIAFSGCGVLSWFGVPQSVQLFLFLISLFTVYISLLFLFESRNRTIQDNPFKIRGLKAQTIYYTLNYACCMLSMSGFISTPSNQEAAKLEILETNPCPALEFFSSPVFVWMSDEYWIDLTFFVIAPIQLANCMGNVLFQTGCSIYYLYISKTAVISVYTRQMQQRFFVGSVVQAAVPTTLIAIPYCLVTVASATGEITQGMTNLLFILLGFHGFIESITIIVAHKCYRESICKIWNPAKASSK
ncbi:hypothetical protein CAEBREN_14862 [Caenorhabditis brenneri]|uniref:Serpentine Receptor, class H n=1 Tax=Caenorhabditis brenneri TaxID=135651 RepID=G0N9W1_CAEBE|nr:hypothetical protein CAEBREN_14862 [Caenorhabditis brenneri]